MSNNKDFTQSAKNISPLVIGAVGGSGTRLITQILQTAGYYMGEMSGSDQKDGALDSLWFNFLLRRPAWFAKNHEQHPEKIRQGLSILEKVMLGAPVRTKKDLIFMTAALKNYRHFRKKKDKLIHLFSAIHGTRILKNSFLGYKTDRSDAIGWGWKDPASHAFLPYLADYFPNLRYVHVIRHGLDMAYSHNQYQSTFWAKAFNLKPARTPDEVPKISLNYWIQTNQKAANLANEKLKDRFLVVKYEDICLQPQQTIQKLLEFASVPPEKVDIEKFSAMIKASPNIGRYKAQDLSIFSAEEIQAVKDLGYEVEAN